MAEFLHDILTLAELQYRLFALDAQQASRRIWHVAFVFAFATVVLASCVPFALVTIALVIAALTKISYATAFCWTLCGALILAAALFGGAVARLRSGIDFFQRSRTEFGENVRSVKSTLRRVSRSNSRSPTGREEIHND